MRLMRVVYILIKQFHEILVSGDIIQSFLYGVELQDAPI